jgi:hypothetical protein
MIVDGTVPSAEFQKVNDFRFIPASGDYTPAWSFEYPVGPYARSQYGTAFGGLSSDSYYEAAYTGPTYVMNTVDGATANTFVGVCIVTADGQLRTFVLTYSFVDNTVQPN